MLNAMPPPSSVMPDLDQISHHLNALFPPAFVHHFPDAQIEIAHGSPATGPKFARLFSAFRLEDAAAFAFNLSKQGDNVYVGVALRSAGANKHKRAGKADVLTAHFGWTDFDSEGDLARAQSNLVRLGIRPHMVVMTGEVPHDRFHLYFGLAGILDLTQLETANTALHACLGGDQVSNADRIMRLAGTVNYPNESKSLKGYVIEMVTLDVKPNVAPYNLGHLTALGAKSSKHTEYSTGHTGHAQKSDDNPYLAYGDDLRGRDDEALVGLLKRSQIAGQWHASMLQAVATMLGRGWGESAIRLACSSYCDGGYGDPDLAPLIKGGQAKGWGEDRIVEAGSYPSAQTPQIPPPLAWADMSDWDNVDVPVRQWAIPDRVPLNQAGLFSGEGGTGKSIIELMKDVAHVVSQTTQRDWMGALPEPGPAFYLGAEDDIDELHIRLSAIAEHYDTSFAELTKLGLHILPLLGEDAVLCRPSRAGTIETTRLFDQILEAAGDIKPRNISIDTLSRAFAGNEIDRGQVYGFAMHMQKLAKVAGGSVTVLSHPSLAGLATGTGLSGSTAWHGAFRFRQYLSSVKAADDEPGQDQPKNNLRQLEFKKNQYGPLADSLVLEYRGGLFLPISGQSPMERVAHADLARRVFLIVLKRLLATGVNLSHKPTARNYAPLIIGRENEAKLVMVRKLDLVVAMRDLFESQLLQNVEYGPPSRRADRLEPR